MSKKEIFQKYPYTIRLKAKNNTMVPVQKFNKEKYEGQDFKLQEIVPYTQNQRKTNNVGLLMNRLLVIDLDVGHQKDVDGRVVFRNWIYSNDKTDIQSRLIAEDINNTMRVRTPSGGLHIYFMLPHNVKDVEGSIKQSAMKGVDLLTGKYNHVPAPGCDRGDGVYTIHETSSNKILEAPKWVLNLFEDSAKKKNAKTLRNGEVKVESKHEDAPLRRIFQAMQHGFQKGERDTKMTSIIGTIHWYVSNDKFQEDDAIYIVETIAEKCNPPISSAKLEKIWNSVVATANKNYED